MIVCINGEFIDEKDAKISVFDHGLLYGDGLFDTIAAVDGKIYWLEEHIDRLLEGCKELYIKIPWSKEQLIDLCTKAFEKNNEKDGRIRITITRGQNGIPIYSALDCKPNLIIFSSELKHIDKDVYERGFRLMTTRYTRPFPTVKNLNYLPSIISVIEASNKGYDDALFIDPEEKVKEGTISNIFMVRDNKVKTPVGGILPGITAKKVVELSKELDFETSEENFDLAELMNADEVFITGTTKKIMPVSKIDQTDYSAPGKITRQLMKKFSEIYY